MEGASNGGCSPVYLSKHYTALTLRVLGGGGGMNFDINGTASVDNGSYWPDLFNANWSLCAKFSLFVFFLILWGQFLLHTEASFHSVKTLPSISAFLFLSLLWHVWANRNFLPALPFDIILFLFDSWEAVWGSTFIGRGVPWPWCHLCSVGGPQHESRHQRKWVVIPQGDKLIKSSSVTAKEIKKNRGQICKSNTSVCLFILHSFNE